MRDETVQQLNTLFRPPLWLMGLIIIRSPYWKNITTTPKTKCLIIVCTMNTKALFHATPMVLCFRRVSSSQTQEWTRLLVIHVIQIVHWGLSCLSFRKFLRAVNHTEYLSWQLSERMDQKKPRDCPDQCTFCLSWVSVDDERTEMTISAEQSCIQQMCAAK